MIRQLQQIGVLLRKLTYKVSHCQLKLYGYFPKVKIKLLLSFSIICNRFTLHQHPEHKIVKMEVVEPLLETIKMFSVWCMYAFYFQIIDTSTQSAFKRERHI